MIVYLFMQQLPAHRQRLPWLQQDQNQQQIIVT